MSLFEKMGYKAMGCALIGDTADGHQVCAKVVGNNVLVWRLVGNDARLPGACYSIPKLIEGEKVKPNTFSVGAVYPALVEEVA